MKYKILKYVEEKWRAIVIVIGLIFIGMGAIQILMESKIDDEISKNIEYALMGLAAVVFIYGKKQERLLDMEEIQEEEEIQEKEENKEDNV